MAISILNNIPSLAAENQLSITQANLNKTLEQLASGSRINTGADDAAGLAIADGLQANVTALTQSALNANEGVGKLQVADGALSQVTTLLNRAVTLATESANGTVNDGSQRQGARCRIPVDQGGNRPHRHQHHLQRLAHLHRRPDQRQPGHDRCDPSCRPGQRHYRRHENQVLGHHAGGACLHHGRPTAPHRRRYGGRPDQRHQRLGQGSDCDPGQHRQRGGHRHAEPWHR